MKMKVNSNKEINTIDDLEIGTIFECSWWNMSDFYELVGKTKQSVKLREIRWTTGLGPDGKPEDDPTWRWCHIVRDEKGNVVPERDQFTGKEKVYTKRVINLPNGGITFKSPNYDGQANVRITNSDYTHMYWG
jgi:hypothetical protein